MSSKGLVGGVQGAVIGLHRELVRARGHAQDGAEAGGVDRETGYAIHPDFHVLHGMGGMSGRADGDRRAGGGAGSGGGDGGTAFGGGIANLAGSLSIVTSTIASNEAIGGNGGQGGGGGFGQGTGNNPGIDGQCRADSPP